MARAAEPGKVRLDVNSTTRVVFRPLTFNIDKDDVVISSPHSPHHMSLSVEAQPLIERLQAGATLGAVIAEFDLDPETTQDLLKCLVDCGLVARLGDRDIPMLAAAGDHAAADHVAPAPGHAVAASAAPDPAAPDPAAPARNSFGGFRRRGITLGISRVRPARLNFLVSPLALIFYVACLLFIVGTFVVVPGLRPKAADWFFSTSLSVSMFGNFIMAWTIVLGHEMAHMLAARQVGLAGILSIGYRQRFIVAQTDVSDVWRVPHRKRYNVYLAGLAYEFILMTTILILLILDSTGFLVLGTTGLILKAVLYARVLSVFWQFRFNMQTDIYYTIGNLLNHKNLMEDSRAYLAYLWARVRRRTAKPLRLRPKEWVVVKAYLAFAAVTNAWIWIAWAFLVIPVWVRLISTGSQSIWRGLTGGGLLPFLDGFVVISITLFNWITPLALAWRARRRAKLAPPEYEVVLGASQAGGDGRTDAAAGQALAQAEPPVPALAGSPASAAFAEPPASATPTGSPAAPVARPLYLRALGPLNVRRSPVGVFVLSQEGADMEVDETAVSVLALCDGRYTAEEIVADVLGPDPAPSDRTAIERLLSGFKSDGLVVETSEPSPVEPFYQGDRPLAMIIEITHACNENCRFCLRPTGPTASGELPDSVFLDLVDEAAGLGVSPVNITGGEPLLRTPLVLEMARRLQARGAHVHLLTNALLVTDQLARELRAAGVENAQVSLDSVNPERHDLLRGRKGAHAGALAGIKRLREAGIGVNTATVINRRNWDERNEIIALARSVADWCKISAQLPLERGVNDDLLGPREAADCRLLLTRGSDGTVRMPFVPRDRCSIGASPVIAPDGTIYPCMLGAHRGLELGVYPRDTLAAIWRDQGSGPCRLSDLRSVNVEELDGCRQCEARYFCGGGCRASAFAATGSYRGRDPVRCPTNKIIFRVILTEGDATTKDLARRCLGATQKPHVAVAGG